MIKEIKKEYSESGTIFHLICSEMADIENLPTLTGEDEYYKANRIAPGSTCICTENASVYMMSADGYWYLIEQKMGPDFKNKVVKPGATDELTGMWQFNDEIDTASCKGWNFDFEISGTGGTNLWGNDSELWWSYDYDGDGSPDGEEPLYMYSWMSGSGPIFATSATVDSVLGGEALLAWLKANATKIA